MGGAGARICLKGFYENPLLGIEYRFRILLTGSEVFALVGNPGSCGCWVPVPPLTGFCVVVLVVCSHCAFGSSFFPLSALLGIRKTVSEIVLHVSKAGINRFIHVQHGWASKTCWLKEARYGKPHTVWFHSCDMSRSDKISRDGKLISGCLRLGMEWGRTAGGREVLFQGDRNILKLGYSDGYTTL